MSEETEHSQSNAKPSTSSTDVVAPEHDDLPTLDALAVAFERLQQPGVPYDPEEWLALLDQYVLLAEAQSDNPLVFEQATRLATFITSRGFGAAEGYLRLAKLNYLQGDFLEARRNVALAKTQVFPENKEEKVRDEIVRFEATLSDTIVKEGQKMFLIISAVAAAGILWFLASRKRN